MLSQKVSVVVPIYKVEKYINRCIESIISQTYSDIEIILVNDGSPDQCGEIADQYAKTDKRIKVIHKDNGGLSDARNVGMEHVTGEFILFVDSDDWLDKNLIYQMMYYMDHYKADAVQSAFYYAYDEYLIFDNRYFSKDHVPIVLNNKSLMSELVINEKVKNFAWGKLIKTNIVRDIPFKKGVLFEDVFWAHKVMQRINTYVIIHQPMYYYYQRNDSIVANYTTRNLDIIKGLKERHIFIVKFYKELTGESYKTILKTSLIHYNLLLLNRKKDKDGLLRKEIQAYIKEHFTVLVNSIDDHDELITELKLFIIHPYINILYLLGKKILRKLKMLQQPNGLERIDIEDNMKKGISYQ